MVVWEMHPQFCMAHHPSLLLLCLRQYYLLECSEKICISKCLTSNPGHPPWLFQPSKMFTRWAWRIACLQCLQPWNSVLVKYVPTLVNHAKTCVKGWSDIKVHYVIIFNDHKGGDTLSIKPYFHLPSSNYDAILWPGLYLISDEITCVSINVCGDYFCEHYF